MMIDEYEYQPKWADEKWCIAYTANQTGTQISIINIYDFNGEVVPDYCIQDEGGEGAIIEAIYDSIFREPADYREEPEYSRGY